MIYTERAVIQLSFCVKIPNNLRIICKKYTFTILIYDDMI